jgi:preprotein translocase subunit SecD
VETPAIVSGNDLRNATAIPSTGGSTEYSVSFSLRPDGAKRLSSWTREHINEYLAVILNDEIESIAFVKSEMYDTGEISGRFTKQSAEDLAKVLTSSAFPAKVRFIEERVD